MNAIFDDLNTSLVDTGAEAQVFDQIFRELQTQITSYAADQAIATAEINLVNPAVSDAVDSLRDYNDVLSETGVSFQSVEDISQDVTSEIRGQAIAFDNLRAAAETTDITLDDLDATMQRIDEAADDAETSIVNFGGAFDRLGSNIIDFVDDVASGGGVIDAFENLGLSVADAFVNEFESNLNERLASTIADALGDGGGGAGAGAAAANASGLSGGLASIGAGIAAFAIPVAALTGLVYGLVTRDDSEARARNALGGDLLTQDEVRGQQGIRGGEIRGPNPIVDAVNEVLSPIGLELSDEGVISTVQGKVRRQISPQDPSILTGVQGGAGPQNAQQFLAANSIIRNLTPGQDDQERGVVFDPDAIVDAVEETTAVIEEALAGSEAGVPDPAADPLGTFSLTRGEREVLAPYLASVRDAEDAIEDLTEDSTPQEIADAYGDLVFAQTNLSSITEGIIRAAEDVGRITGTAAINAIDTLESDLGDDIKVANNTLISTLGDVGYEVIGALIT